MQAAIGENTRSARKRAKSFVNIIHALVLHDIKNRFFGSGLGQIIMVFWPFVHILVLIVIYAVAKRPHPYGDSMVQYSAVSIYPFIVFNYVSKWIVYSAISNKSFLQLGIIKPFDILFARTLLEIISITMVGMMLIIFVFSLGFNIMPSDPLQALYAVLSTLFLAIGLGFFNAPFAFIIPFWNIVMVLIIITSWIASGVAFVASDLPEQIRTPLSYNPLLHCVEWLRSSYYFDYPTSVLDKSYVLEFGLTTLTLGFILNRLLHRFY